jgi:hypothetical protein
LSDRGRDALADADSESSISCCCPATDPAGAPAEEAQKPFAAGLTPGGYTEQHGNDGGDQYHAEALKLRFLFALFSRPPQECFGSSEFGEGFPEYFLS